MLGFGPERPTGQRKSAHVRGARVRILSASDQGRANSRRAMSTARTLAARAALHSASHRAQYRSMALAKQWESAPLAECERDRCLRVLSSAVLERAMDKTSLLPV